jgi:predicted RNA binding protein YcfA (HicA-like mRNA interferase family)
VKRREFIRYLEANGRPFKREGAAHTIYWNPATGRREPLPRHSEIPDLLEPLSKLPVQRVVPN